MQRRSLTVAEWVLIALPAAFISFHTLQNNDLPMHLAIGEWILEQGVIPHQDPFAGSVDNAPWVPHEWLAGVGAALVHRLAGAWGLVAAAVAGGVLFALCHAAVVVRIGGTRLGLLLWSAPLWLMAGRRLMLRPHLLSLILVFLLWWILLEARRRPRLLWLVPLVLAFWVNVHGSYYLGLGIVFCGLLLDGGQHAGSVRQRIGIFVLSALALLVQPYGLEGLLHPLRLTGSEVFMQQVLEWAPPLGSSANSAFFRTTPGFAISVVFCCVLLPCLARRTVPLPYGLFLLAALLLYLRHQRYLALFAAAALPYAPWIGLTIKHRARAWLPRSVPLALAIFVLAVGFPVTWSSVRPPIRAGGVQLWAPQLPIWEVDQLVQSGFRGKVFCEYDHGGVVAWRSSAQLQPTMDSRNSVYGAALFEQHQAALAGNGSPFLDTAEVAIVAAPWLRQRSELHETLLDRDGPWLLLSYNYYYFCYVRAGSAGGTLDQSTLRLVRPDVGWSKIQSAEQLPRLLAEADFGFHQYPRPITALSIYGKAHLMAVNLALQRGAEKGQVQASLQKARAATQLLRARTDRRPVDTQNLRDMEQLLAKIEELLP